MGGRTGICYSYIYIYIYQRKDIRRKTTRNVPDFIGENDSSKFSGTNPFDKRFLKSGQSCVNSSSHLYVQRDYDTCDDEL